MPSISKKITYSEEPREIYSAMYQLRKAAVQPQEDLHHEGSGISTVSLDKLEPVYESALQAMNLVETNAKVYVRRENVKLKVRVEQPASGQWRDTVLTMPFNGTRESAAATLKCHFINDVLGFRHCTRPEQKVTPHVT